MNVPVAGLPVQQKVTAVNLVFLQIQPPDVPVILDENLGGRITGAAGSKGEEVPHKPRFLPGSRLCKLNLHQEVIPLRGKAVLKPHFEAKKQIG